MTKISLMLVLLVIIPGCRIQTGGKKEVSSINEPMMTHCVGRHVIEMPGSFAASPVTTGIFKAPGLSAQDASFDVVVHTAGLTRSQFSTEVAKRRAELKRSASKTVDVLRLEKELSDDVVLFRIQRIDDAYVSEINALRGSSMVTVTLDSYNGKFLGAEESLVKFVAAINETDNKTPAEQSQGFCLGSVAVAGEFKTEKGSFLFANGRGADFEVEIDTYGPDDRVPLLTRMSGPDSLLTIFDVHHKVLRTRERTVAGMGAQEWLGWAKLTDEQDAKTLKFTLETVRPSPGKATPSINLTFNTAKPLEDGSPSKTMMSDDEAIKLWDSVVNSIHPAKFGR
jgi:hypothetical protein